MTMARNYAALPYEYLEEMGCLGDAEFGRLTRALLVYSMTGEFPALSGNEKFFSKRVMMQEDRYRESYEELKEIRADAGKKGARTRWANDGKNGKAIFANGKNSKAINDMANDGKNSKAIFANGKNGNTETKTKTEIETDILSSNDDKNNAHECARAVVVAAYTQKIIPTPSTVCLAELSGFVDELGHELCLRAIDIAVDASQRNWPYVKGILKSWNNAGCKSLDDVERKNAEHERRKRNGRERNYAESNGKSEELWNFTGVQLD